MPVDPSNEIRSRLQTVARLAESYGNRSGSFADDMLGVLAATGMIEHEIELIRGAAHHALRAP
jgi:hypothetical protein